MTEVDSSNISNNQLSVLRYFMYFWRAKVYAALVTGDFRPSINIRYEKPVNVGSNTLFLNM
jgi:hypothetical protein